MISTFPGRAIGELSERTLSNPRHPHLIIIDCSFWAHKGQAWIGTDSKEARPSLFKGLDRVLAANLDLIQSEPSRQALTRSLTWWHTKNKSGEMILSCGVISHFYENFSSSNWDSSKYVRREGVQSIRNSNRKVRLQTYKKQDFRIPLSSRFPSPATTLILGHSPSGFPD